MITTLSSLHIYPVKSLQSIDLQEVVVDEFGPSLDRRWMVVDSTGHFMSQRKYPKMATIKAEITSNRLILKAANYSDLILALREEGQERAVVVWKDTCLGIDQGECAAQWLSSLLEEECRLVYMPKQTIRKINPQYAISEKDRVSFADGYPFLLVSEASLAELNQRLEQSIPLNRFRPNLVVKNCQPFEEDRWKKIKIGEIVFSLVKPCARCVITTIDQKSGEKRSAEPLLTLSSYRKQEKGIMFGQNLIHHNTGKLKVGDSVQILESI